jgi:hypothetical protein
MAASHQTDAALEHIKNKGDFDRIKRQVGACAAVFAAAPPLQQRARRRRR